MDIIDNTSNSNFVFCSNSDVKLLHCVMHWFNICGITDRIKGGRTSAKCDWPTMSMLMRHVGMWLFLAFFKNIIIPKKN